MLFCFDLCFKCKFLQCLLWLPATIVVIELFDSTAVNECLYELLQRRQEELERKAEELARKEEELKNAGNGTGRCC